MAQLSYGYDTPKGNPGLIFDIAPHECRTRLIEGTAGSVAAGMGVVNGTNAGTQVKVPGSSSDVFAGILVEKAHEMDKNGQVIVDPKEAFSVMVAGHIWGQISPECTPTFGAAAYLIRDGVYAGMFTNQSSSYSQYEQVKSTTSGAKEIVADDTASPTSSQIKLAAVTPVAPGYAPKVGDYVKSVQTHDAGLNVGVKFGAAADAANGIAEIVL